MGRFKTNQEREAKALKKTDDERKEHEENMAHYRELASIPGFTGDPLKDQFNPGIQEVIKRRNIRQKIG